MKRILAALMLLAAPTLYGQYVNSKANSVVLKGGGLAIPAGYFVIQNEGVDLNARPIVNFIGGGIDCVDNAGAGRTDCTVSTSGAYAEVDDEGGALTARTKLNFIGAGVTCADDAGNTRTNCTIPGSSASFYQTVMEEGAGLTQRGTINFIGTWLTCADNAGSTRTDCTIAPAGILGSANGGTANGFTKFSGPTTAEKTFTLPDASTTILTTNALVTPSQGGTGTAIGITDRLTTVGPYRDEFMGGCTNITATGSSGMTLGWTITNTGGTVPGTIGPAGATADFGDHPGACQYGTGTGSGAGVTSLNGLSNVSGGGAIAGDLFKHAETLEWESCVSALSDAADIYTARQGFGDSKDSAAPTDGCWVDYTNGTNAGHWVAHCKNNAGPTDANAAVGPTVCPTYQRIKITVNSDATSVNFLFDGANGVDVAGNIPTVAGREFGTMFQIMKTGGSTGTTQRWFQLDYVEWTKTVSR